MATPGSNPAPDPDGLARAAAASLEDHIRAMLRGAGEAAHDIVAAAEGEAAQLRRAGEADAEQRRQACAKRVSTLESEAIQTARQVLARIGAIEDRLGTLAEELREEVGQTRSHRGGVAPETELEAVSGVLRDVTQIADNLRIVMEGGRSAPRLADDHTKPDY